MQTPQPTLNEGAEDRQQTSLCCPNFYKFHIKSTFLHLKTSSQTFGLPMVVDTGAAEFFEDQFLWYCFGQGSKNIWALADRTGIGQHSIQN
ncbi:hypothetical protein AVEN_93389-1 [Araneus ventricosus]|uniref:Uncharacterized protein n=1 Tax=Araneus ventricosus TaxID=182803 RepID=A0A4Y2ANW6_ARAVE|nr:hypothetical protein AVEN_93389-1 [Araneus ventricosus]